MDTEKIFKEEEIDNHKFGCYEYRYIPRITSLNAEKALELLRKKLKKDV